MQSKRAEHRARVEKHKYNRARYKLSSSINTHLGQVKMYNTLLLIDRPKRRYTAKKDEPAPSAAGNRLRLHRIANEVWHGARPRPVVVTSFLFLLAWFWKKCSAALIALTFGYKLFHLASHRWIGSSKKEKTENPKRKADLNRGERGACVQNRTRLKEMVKNFYRVLLSFQRVEVYRRLRNKTLWICPQVFRTFFTVLGGVGPIRLGA